MTLLTYIGIGMAITWAIVVCFICASNKLKKTPCFLASNREVEEAFENLDGSDRGGLVKPLVNSTTLSQSIAPSCDGTRPVGLSVKAGAESSYL